MQLLLLSTWFPYPLDNGSRIRAYNLLRHLVARHQVHLVSFVRDHEADTRGEIARWCATVETVPWIEFVPARWRALLGYLSIAPRSVVDTHSETMAHLVRRRLTVYQPDVVVALETPVARYLPGRVLLPAIVDEVQVAIFKDAAERSSNLLTRLRARLTWLKQRYYLVQLLRRYSACTVASRVEQENLRVLLPDNYPVHVIPNGVDTEHHRLWDVAPRPNTLIYSGALTYSANYDAVDYFLRAILPRIRTEVPEVQFRVTGSTRGVPLERLPQCPGVIFTGYLENIRPAVGGSWALVVPLRVGGGTRLKILEAMALGTPVVSTSKGAEGLEVTHEEHILIADDPADFARQTVRLLRDPALRHRLAMNGRRLVEQKYSWTEIGRQFCALVEQVAQERRRRSC